MQFNDIFDATLLGLIEGLTEFIPVSSTAHLLLIGQAIGWRSTGHSFEVLIQLGAVLAVLSVYFGKLWHLARTLPTEARNAPRRADAEAERTRAEGELLQV